MTNYQFHYLASLYLTSVTTISMGLFILLRRENLSLHRIFALYCFAIGGWSFLQGSVIFANAETMALLVARLLFIPVILIPAFFFHFISRLLQKPSLGRLV